MASASDITLYWGDGSPPCWSILVVLEEKQLHGYNSRCLSFDKKDNKSAEILEMNPRGELPSCKIGDMVINESLAVCLHLEEANPGRGYSLMPTDPKQRALIWQKVCEFYWNFPRRCYKNYVRYLWYTPAEKRDSARVDEAREECLRELELWEGYLRNKGDTKYIVGDSFTMADVIAFPWLAFLVNLGLQLRPRFEKLAAYYDVIKDRPSIQKHWPKRWDGSIDETVLQGLY